MSCVHGSPFFFVLFQPSVQVYISFPLKLAFTTCVSEKNHGKVSMFKKHRALWRKQGNSYGMARCSLDKDPYII